MRILWLKTELLHPVNKGGRIRTYNMLRELRKKHEIIYLTLDHGSGDREAVERASEYADELIRVPHELARRHSLRFYGQLALNLASPLPYFVQRFRSAPMRRTVAQTLEERDVDVVVCDFLVPAVNLPDRVEAPTVLFQHNVEAEIWRRHHEVAQNPVKRLYFYHQWSKARKFEALTCRRFDRIVAVSEQDRETLEEAFGLDHVDAVETGVDTDYFRPREPRPPQRTHHLVFTGSMDWLPNEDAMTWFVSQILPRIRAEIPESTLSIVGRRPSPQVRALEEEPNVIVTGKVPDIRPFLEEASVFVVPLRIGSGTRLKIYEAMAMERPVVSTSIGMEGLPVTHGEELVVADDADDFAAAVTRLLRAPDEAKTMGQRAADRVRRDFGWDGVASEFADICGEAIRHRVEQGVGSGSVGRAPRRSETETVAERRAGQ